MKYIQSSYPIARQIIIHSKIVSYLKCKLDAFEMLMCEQKSHWYSQFLNINIYNIIFDATNKM
jgi:hypothetical protein